MDTKPPIWAQLGFGQPHCDQLGTPQYLRWEKVADEIVHICGVTWTATSVSLLLVESTKLRTMGDVAVRWRWR